MDQEAQQAASLDLDQLANMDIKVTSASKKSESLFGAPAAIYVLTSEDLRRGGFTTVPEALRMVPGLYVAETNAHTWEVSTRGFASLNNNKMLVLVDGRSVYSPELGTVRWDTLDMPLENIARIEIIRGPGGTLWGANAVNGVINIVTMTARQMRGVLVSTSGGSAEGDTGTVRYGGDAGSNVTYSVFGKASYWEPFGSMPAADHFGMVQGELRVDWKASNKDEISLLGGSYDGRQGVAQNPFTPPVNDLIKGSHVVLHWKRSVSRGLSMEGLAYCDWYIRYGTPGEKRTNCDAEFQQTRQLRQRHSLVWGGSLFTTADDLRPDTASFSPEQRRTNVVSGFAQYEWDALPDRLRILAGSKFEHNDFTGFEYQPQIRAVWTPNYQNALWIAISRSIRLPSRNNSDLNLFTQAGFMDGEPVFQSVVGNPNLRSEKLLAYEAGYRTQPWSHLGFDLAVYYNDYRNLINASGPVAENLGSVIVLRSRFINSAAAETNGGELSAHWQAFHRWMISGGITELHGSELAVQQTPAHLFNLQSRMDLPGKIDFTLGVYRDAATRPGVGTNPATTVAAFNRVDLGGSWRFRPNWTFSVWGRNLQSSGHMETPDTIFGDPALSIPRSLVFKLVWHSVPEKRALPRTSTAASAGQR